MKTQNFPVMALALALFIQLLLPLAGTVDSKGETMLPLLTLLLIAEFGFVVALIGVYIAARQQLKHGFSPIGAGIAVLTAILAISLLLQGIELWPL